MQYFRLWASSEMHASVCLATRSVLTLNSSRNNNSVDNESVSYSIQVAVGYVFISLLIAEIQPPATSRISWHTIETLTLVKVFTVTTLMQLQKHLLHICYSKAFQVDDPIVLVVMVVCTTCSMKHLLQVMRKLYITLPSFGFSSTDCYCHWRNNGGI